MIEIHLTIVILTKNEERNLPRCLDGIPERYPIIVVDSGSTDATHAIARGRCAIYNNPWPGFAAQRNFALQECSVATPWVLFVDADEVYPTEFYDWFESHITASEEIDVYMVPQVLYFCEKRLRYAPGYPIYHPRLVHRGRTRFVTNHTGHGEAVLSACRIAYAKIPYDHYFYNGEVMEWMHKHVDKAAQEVHLTATAGAMMTTRGRLSLMFGRSVLRIFARFMYHYILRGGMLDGAAGMEYSLMWSWYEATIYLQAKAKALANVRAASGEQVKGTLTHATRPRQPQP